MRVLVTGGAGFIGSHLVDRLVKEGHEVAVVDNLVTGKRKNLNDEARFYKMDILSPRIEKVLKKERPEVISHHAAQIDVRRSVADPLFDTEVNILGFLNVLQHAVKHGVRKVIFASSGGAVYGEQQVFPADETHPTLPLSPYGISKLAGEHYLRYYHLNSGIEYVCLRYANVYGPRQDPFGEAGVVAIFTQKLLMKDQPIINGNGKQTRDYVFVEDVVEAHMAVTPHGINGVYNVGTAKETSVNQLFRYLVEITGSSAKEVYGPEKRGEQLRSCIDASHLQKAADWEPRVAVYEGLQRTVEYYRSLIK
jgi:UDP-glucose 4-epimerase